MADTVIKTAKTVEKALQAALEELGVPEEQVMYEVLDRPSKGLFGLLGGKPARVRVTRKEEKTGETELAEEQPPVQETAQEDAAPAESKEEAAPMAEDREEIKTASEWDQEVLTRAEKFLQDIFRIMQIEVEIRSESTEEGYLLNLEGKNLGILIGKHGQTLDALQYLTNLAANREHEQRVRVFLDVEGYRTRRTETLQKLANRLADRALRIHQEIKLEPMNRHERKIIHMTLQERHRISTYSDGEEPYRYVVIVPEKSHRKYQ